MGFSVPSNLPSAMACSKQRGKPKDASSCLQTMAVLQRFVLGHFLLKWEEAECLFWVSQFRKLSKGWDFREIWGLAWKDWLFHWEPNYCSANCKVSNQEEWVVLNCSAEQWFFGKQNNSTQKGNPNKQNNIYFCHGSSVNWKWDVLFSWACVQKVIVSSCRQKLHLGLGRGKRRVGRSMSAESLMQEDASAVLCLVASCVNPSTT